MPEPEGTFEHNGAHYPIYHPPTVQSMVIEMQLFQWLFEKFCNKLNNVLRNGSGRSFHMSDFSIDEDIMIEIFKRIDQRKLHYKMYHNCERISELKEIALLAYWITRLRPISYNHGGVHTPGYFNELFSLITIMATIQEFWSTRGIERREFELRLLRDVFYTLQYRVNTYDSLTLLVDGLAG